MYNHKRGHIHGICREDNKQSLTIVCLIMVAQ